MKFGIKNADGFLIDRITNEVVLAFGYEEDKQKEVSKLIKLRTEAKKKRMRKKINKKIDKLLGR